MCTLTTMKPPVTLHSLNLLSKIGNQKPIDGTLSHILCRMVQENPNAWRDIPITLPLARKTVSSDSSGHSINDKNRIEWQQRQK